MFLVRLLSLSTVVVLLSIPGWAQEETPSCLVDAVTMTGGISIDENALERILGIRKIVGTFQLSEQIFRLDDEVHSVRLRVDLYRNGRPVQTHRDTEWSCGQRYTQPRRVFARSPPGSHRALDLRGTATWLDRAGRELGRPKSCQSDPSRLRGSRRHA